MVTTRTICAFSILILLTLPTSLCAEVIDGGFNEASIGVSADSGATNTGTSGPWTATATSYGFWSAYPGRASVGLSGGTATFGAFGMEDMDSSGGLAQLSTVLVVPPGSAAVLSFDVTESNDGEYDPGNPSDNGTTATMSLAADGSGGLDLEGGGHFSIPLPDGPTTLTFRLITMADTQYPGSHYGSMTITNFGITVPEPGTLTLLVSALLGLAGAFYLRRRRAKA